MNRVCSIRTALLVLGALFVLSAVSFAQTDLGSIQGFVKDPSGAVVPGAKVSARNQAGLERQTTTNESGFYTITNIPAQFYTVTVEAAGFKKFESKDNKLDASTVLSMDALLTVGAATEVVEVTATATPCRQNPLLSRGPSLASRLTVSS